MKQSEIVEGGVYTGAVGVGMLRRVVSKEFASGGPESSPCIWLVTYDIANDCVMNGKRVACNIPPVTVQLRSFARWARRRVR